MKYGKDIARFVRSGDFKETEGGLLIHSAIMAKGKYYHSLNGEDLQVDPNLVVAEGILKILDTALGGDTQITAWYLAPFSGNATPDSSWTGANFVSQGEFTGYDETTRVAWAAGAAAAGRIGNLTARAVFTISTGVASTSIYGAGLLSNSTKSSNTGTLVSATRFANSRTVIAGDTFELGYEVELTDS